MLLVTLLIGLAGCDQTPTGRNQIALVPEDMLTRMGQETFTEMKRAHRASEDDAAREMVQCVARAVIAAAADQYPEAERPERWEVVLFDNPTPNAFALPGGHIGVHSGLLRVAGNPDQLAAVMGHEVGHLLADHGNERLTQQLGIKAVLIVVGLFTDIENRELLQALGLGAQLGITLPFSRAHEREADVMGLNIMAAAGFRPDESVALWRNMADQSSGQPIEFLSTHPAHDTRIELLQTNMERAERRYRQAVPAACSR
ncbi:M48 family metallopeptidase [Ectothiorhodospiraceae bacterium WFHF3C12]|nr:M48 family metallopeptidase [Ectothiorhodospiraceae bacterium WFHF3C12]